MKWIIFLAIIIPFCIAAAVETKQGEQKIIYKYKKYEKFDFDDLDVEGETGSPGDLSVNQRYQRKFKNILPYRKNFNPELVRTVLRLK